MARLVVRIRLATGVDFPVRVDVQLNSAAGFIRRTQQTLGNGEVLFTDLPLTAYHLEVKAEGFETATEMVFLSEASVAVPIIIFLQPASGAGATTLAKPPILLAPRAQREADRALAALRDNDLKTARQHIERALKMAPGHPDLNYLAGLIYAQAGEDDLAIEHLEKAASLSPDSAPIHLALGNALYRKGAFEQAVTPLERTLVLDANQWQAHWVLANCLFQIQEFEKAIAHSQKAQELDANRVPQADLVIGFALAALGKTAEAREALAKFLRQHPAHASADTARQRLVALSAAAAPGDSLTHPETPPAGAERGLTRRGGLLPAAAPTQPAPEPSPRAWSPPSVPAEGPPVAADIACSTSEVLRRAGANIIVLAQNLGRVSATEQVFHEDLGADGLPRSQDSRQFQYVAAVRETRPGTLSLEEYRQRSGGAPLRAGETELFLHGGLAGLAFLFHPYYAGDFQMHCEGLATWRGQPAWQITFRQKDGVESRVRVFHTARGRFPVALKGRAWFGVNHHQILRIEADLVEPLPSIALNAEHMAIDYTPVDFPRRNVQLWLPALATLYAEYGGRRMRRVHQLSDFLLFTVDTRHQTSDPP